MSDDALPATLDDIELDLPDRRVGKVRVSYGLPSNRRLFVTTDRLSAFDRLVASVPLKGRVLNQLSAWWFETTRDIVANHVIAVPHPNVLVAVAARPLPVEVIVRGYITGVTGTSLWKRYADGARLIYGYEFPDGMVKNQRLAEPLITPTTKAEMGGHDEVLTCEQVVASGLVDDGLWSRVQDAALALFARGQQVAARAGLILADTKYEFGLGPEGQLLLIDEVHTPDSSRFWVADEGDDSYGARFEKGLEPVSMDKELIRRSLADLGFTGDGEVPRLGSAVLMETSRRYVRAYERITGLDVPSSGADGSESIGDRITRAVSEYMREDI